MSGADDRADFMKRYAARSGLTVAELHVLGLRAEPCDCDDEWCEGWKMVYVANDEVDG